MSSKIPDLQLTISIADTLIQKISEHFNHYCCSESETLKEKKRVFNKLIAGGVGKLRRVCTRRGECRKENGM
jgi:hypothetical protein